MTLLASFAVAESEDQEVAKFLLGLQAIEGNGDVELLAEGAPDAKDLIAGLAALGSVGNGGDLERSAEIRLEAVSLGRCSSFHGLGCGYTWLKWERNSSSVSCCSRDASSAMTLAGPGT